MQQELEPRVQSLEAEVERLLRAFPLLTLTVPLPAAATAGLFGSPAGEGSTPLVPVPPFSEQQLFAAYQRLDVDTKQLARRLQSLLAQLADLLDRLDRSAQLYRLVEQVSWCLVRRDPTIRDQH